MINGEAREFAATLSVAQLLQVLNKSGPQVAVEVNEQLVPRTRHADCELTAGDRIEIVTLVGGG